MLQNICVDVTLVKPGPALKGLNKDYFKIVA